MRRIRCGGYGAGQRDDARGLILVPPLVRDLAHAGGVRQVMPPWFGSWFVPLPAPWCAYWCGAGCLGAWLGFVVAYGKRRVVIRWTAVQFVLHIRRHGVANAYNLGIVGGQLVVIHAS